MISIKEVHNFIKCYERVDFINRLITAWQFCKQALIHFSGLLRWYTNTPLTLIYRNVGQEDPCKGS